MKKLLLVTLSIFVFSCSSAPPIGTEKTVSQNGNCEKAKSSIDCPNGYECARGVATNVADLDEAKKAARASAGAELAAQVGLWIEDAFGKHCQGKLSECQPYAKSTLGALSEAAVYGSKEFTFCEERIERLKSTDSIVYYWNYYTLRKITPTDLTEASISALQEQKKKLRQEGADQAAIEAIDETIEHLKSKARTGLGPIE